jgi:hypothetical protein
MSSRGIELLLGRLNPQDDVESYLLDSGNFKDNATIWTVHMDENKHFICKTWAKLIKPDTQLDEPMDFVLCDSHGRKVETKGLQGALQLQVSVRPDVYLRNTYDNFELRDKVMERCYAKRIVLYARHVIVNRTHLPVQLGEEKKALRYLKPHSSCLFSLNPGTKLCFKTKGFSTALVPDTARLVQAHAGDHDRGGRVLLARKEDSRDRREL